MNRCGKCHTPADAVLCAHCTTALRVELGDVTALLADLDITRSRQDQLTNPYHHGRGGGETPLPYKDITETVWILHHTLHTWATTFGQPNKPTPTPLLAQYLLANLHHIQLHPDAAQFADETTHAIHHARKKIDRPNDRRLFLGLCDAELANHTHCREEIYGVPWHDHATCTNCGTRHHTPTRQQWMRDVAQDHLGTSTEIAGYLRTTGIACTPSMIRNYVARGRLTPATDTHPPLYRIRDVITALENRYRQRRAS